MLVASPVDVARNSAAQDEEKAQQFVDLLRRGAIVYVHPGTLPSIFQRLPIDLVSVVCEALFDRRVKTNPMVDPGTVIAVDIEALRRDHERWLDDSFSSPNHHFAKGNA